MVYNYNACPGVFAGKFVIKNTEPPSSRATKQQLRKVFLDCDADDNMVLTKEEVEKAFDRFGSLFPGFRARKALKCADKNRDGRITVEELDDLIEYAYQRRYINVN